MDKSIRIKANVGKDQVLHVNMKQNTDLFEILSLTLNQSDAYKIHSSNYGIVVGRILANDAFGVPNAKVSIFIPLSSDDNDNVSLRNIYPYEDAGDTNSNGVRYNLLPTYSIDPCYTKVGTFPSKRLVLDDDTVLEIYDKYYKYTTTTNKAGDYMIFGVPTGTSTVHVDVDLSDIGILSQKPRDFVYKGYNINQFASPTKFNSGTTLSSLPQIFSQDETITVYPFWSDANAGEAAISRKDINLQYTFEATCVFLGSVITDTGSNSISHNCEPNEKIGELSQMSTGEGTIEMIRKTPFGNVEEKSIQGNQLIDSNGVWCYQIPMNLDYVGMDEYGNIVPTNDPSKGIPTRTRVRFRISLSEAGYDSTTNHKAKYLVPNNPLTVADENNHPILSGDSKEYYYMFYEFGTSTPECCFRDLYWNCVYTVKNYIPRIQKSTKALDNSRTGIKGINKKAVGNKNLFPYNKVNQNLNISSWSMLNYFLDNANPKEIFEFFFGKGITKNKAYLYYVAKFVEENDGISLDFSNDWVNGVLYFPLWFWRVRKKRKYKKNENVYSSEFCSCTIDMNKKKNRLYNTSTCDLPCIISADSNTKMDDLAFDISSTQPNLDRVIKYERVMHGIIKEVQNKDNLSVYYYATSDNDINFVRLFSTDIVLLGSLNDNDLNGIPKISDNYPSTTALIPPMLSSTFSDYDEDSDEEDDTTTSENTDSTEETNGELSGETITGMLWDFFDGSLDSNIFAKRDITLNNLRSGIFFGFNYGRTLVDRTFRNCLYTLPKTYLNAQRISELGVSLDMRPTDSNLRNFGYNDGLITKHEINDETIRQMFATLNMKPLIASNEYKNNITGYKMYPIRYTCPVNFDGLMSSFIHNYTDGKSTDITSNDYNAFRFGEYGKYKFYRKIKDKYYFPAYDNSFYFYFGLNQGNTAIDKFKSQFYQNCSENAKMEDKLPFDYSINVIDYPTKENPLGNIEIKITLTTNNNIEFTVLLDNKEQQLTSSDTLYKNVTFTYDINNLYPKVHTIYISMTQNGQFMGSVTTNIDLSLNK